VAYLDLTAFLAPSNWTPIIAIIALILSQIPPLKEVIKGAKIQIIAPERIGLGHFLGNANVGLYIDIRNTGGRSVNIVKLEFTMVDSDRKISILPAQTYYLGAYQGNNQNPQQVLIGWVHLKPGDNWREAILAYRPWTESEEEHVSDIINRFRDDLTLKLAKNQASGVEELVEADKSIMEVAKNFFESQFNIHKGQYRLYITVHSEENKVLAVKGFEFVLYESSIKSLTSMFGEYRYGSGILYASRAQPLSVRLRPVSDKLSKEDYVKLWS
jgi:hypothetical protein